MPLDVTVVDLTAPLGTDTVMWPGEPRPTAEVTETVERDGSFGRRVTLGEHSGTHFDAPAHFVAGGASVADIPAARLVAPLHVIDISSSAASDRDATLSVDEVAAHETAYGEIAAGSAVFLFTGWDRYRHDVDAYMGSADEMRFPGFGVESARLLVERGVVGVGIDTLSVDSGSSNDFAIHREVTLPSGVWHVENLVNLGAVPPVGATVVVGVPKMVGASGFPARVLALIPRG
jgi:kynurenine formamidase